MLTVIEAHATHEPNGVHAPESSHAPTTPASSILSTRERSDTMMSTISSLPGPQGQRTMSSMFFVVQALETIQNSKEGKKKGPLKDATAKALGRHLSVQSG
jgi:brefeldin A-inhibited guanine nucleotide-exchange protein